MQSNQVLSPHYKSNAFSLSFLKGSIGKAVVTTHFCESGYEIYPFGYENYYANVTRFVKRDYTNATSTILRSMPDLLVYDRDNDETYLLEIKATSRKDESKYWISEDNFDSYRKYWAEAFLLIYFIPTANIYCQRIYKITHWNRGGLPKTLEPGYYLDLAYFYELPDCFRLIKRDRYNELRNEISDILKEYSQISV